MISNDVLKSLLALAIILFKYLQWVRIHEYLGFLHKLSHPLALR